MRRVLNAKSLDTELYASTSGLVLGFHGCDRSVGEKILNSYSEHLLPSEHTYDWLGSGIYFWLNDPVRAFEWAQQTCERTSGAKIREPFVIGAVISLGHCLNLSERSAIEALRKKYEDLRESYALLGIHLNERYVNKAPDEGGFSLIRPLDCFIINSFAASTLAENKTQFDTVYGYFQEGGSAFEGAGFRAKSHVQICVRNPACIKGYFLPRYKS